MLPCLAPPAPSAHLQCQALAALDAVWDSAFDFGPAVQASVSAVHASARHASAAAAAGGKAQGGTGTALPAASAPSAGGAAAAADFLRAVVEEEGEEEEEQSLLHTDGELQLTEDSEQAGEPAEHEQRWALAVVDVAAQAAAAAPVAHGGGEEGEEDLVAEHSVVRAPAAVDVEPVVGSCGSAEPAGYASGAVLAAALPGSDAACTESGFTQALPELPELGCGQLGTPPGDAAGPAEAEGSHQAPSRLSPPMRARRATSSSSLEAAPAVTLRVPRMRPGSSAGALLHGSPSATARLASHQLRHLESLRRQRAQQEAEALECLPSALLRATAEAAAARSPGQDSAVSESPSPRRTLLGGRAGVRRLGSAGRVRSPSRPLLG